MRPFPLLLLVALAPAFPTALAAGEAVLHAVDFALGERDVARAIGAFTLQATHAYVRIEAECPTAAGVYAIRQVRAEGAIVRQGWIVLGCHTSSVADAPFPALGLPPAPADPCPADVDPRCSTGYGFAARTHDDAVGEASDAHTEADERRRLGPSTAIYTRDLPAGTYDFAAAFAGAGHVAARVVAVPS